MVLHADPPETLVDASDSLRERLTTKVTGYESRYGIASEELRSAMETGVVSDTEETCDWLIAYEALSALGRGTGPTQLE